jgi:rubrerythrin
MIKKKLLIEALYDALDREEEANNQFYDYTIKSLKYYKWLSEDKKEKVQNIITKLRDDTQRHKSMVENVIQHVQESDKNVF